MERYRSLAATGLRRGIEVGGVRETILVTHLVEASLDVLRTDCGGVSIDDPESLLFRWGLAPRRSREYLPLRSKVACNSSSPALAERDSSRVLSSTLLSGKMEDIPEDNPDEELPLYSINTELCPLCSIELRPSCSINTELCPLVEANWSCP